MGTCSTYLVFLGPSLTSDVTLNQLGDRVADMFNGHRGESPLEKLEKLQGMHNESLMHMVRTRETLMKVDQDQTKLSVIHKVVLSIKGNIPTLISQGDQLTTAADSALKSLVTLKATASKLVVEVKAIHDAAGFSGSSLDNKEEIGFSILNVCILALIDKNLSDEVQMIMDELVKGYEGIIMPPKVQSKLEETRNVLAPLLEAAA